MKKYDINDFYLGELNFSYSIFDKKNNERNAEKYLRIIKNGAVAVNDISNDVKFGKYYKSVITMFYKKANKGYICIHNGEKYSDNGDVFCSNLVSLNGYLPKLGYVYPKSLSLRNAISVFNGLFKPICYFSSLGNYFDLRRFYAGNLNLYVGYEDSNLLDNGSNYNYSNFYDSYATFNSDAKLIGGFSCFEDTDDSVRRHDYEVFNCIFYRMHNDELYNINNYLMYNKGTMKEDNYKNFRVGDSFYDNMVPLAVYLRNNGMNYNNKKIDLPRVLSYQKRIDVKNRHL